MADEAPLPYDVVEGYVDHKGRPVNRSKSGGWRSAVFIIGVEVAERFAYNGIGSNLVNYLTGPLGQSMATAAANANAWSGMGDLLPLLGAFIADSFLGRYRTIIIASILYTLGLGFLTLSTILPFNSSTCQVTNSMPCSPPQAQVIFFFFSLYLVSFAQGGYRPCVQAFGADQFDEKDTEECKAKSSFFNWWYFGMCFGALVTVLVMSYIQDNLSWGLGFAIPCLVIGLAFILFLLGTTTYRFPNYSVQNPFVRIGRVFIIAARNQRTTYSVTSVEEEESEGLLSQKGSQQFKFLNNALFVATHGSNVGEEVCTINEVEDAKTILRLVPIWVTCLVYGIVFSQSSTLFTKQSLTMDRSIGSSFEVPSASMQSIINLTVIVFLPIYDRILVPIARVVTGIPSGITMLQRVGIGMLLSLISMVIAALVERKRLETAREYGLIDKPNATVPMSLWWMVPQYLLFGICNALAVVGLQEFFYDQVPSGLRSVGLALYLSILGIGSFLSSILISVIENVTGGEGRDSWFSDNLNQAHLDYFYWLLAGMSAVALAAYLYFSKSYIYNRGGGT